MFYGWRWSRNEFLSFVLVLLLVLVLGQCSFDFEDDNDNEEDQGFDSNGGCSVFLSPLGGADNKRIL